MWITQLDFCMQFFMMKNYWRLLRSGLMSEAVEEFFELFCWMGDENIAEWWALYGLFTSDGQQFKGVLKLGYNFGPQKYNLLADVIYERLHNLWDDLQYGSK